MSEQSHLSDDEVERLATHIAHSTGFSRSEALQALRPFRVPPAAKLTADDLRSVLGKRSIAQQVGDWLQWQWVRFFGK